MQYRHEYKHYLNEADYLSVRGRLRAVMKLDAHVSERGDYRIRSLYFDNARDKALLEKVDGISEREKFRIRCYDFHYDFIRLEKKIKKGGLGYKLSAPVSREEVEKLLNGDLEWMKESGEELITELYEKMKLQGLRPKTLVDYTREPYVYPAGNVRVTVDRNICTGVFGTDFLNPDVPMIPSCPGTVLLEVKYDNFLPDMIRDAVQLQFREEVEFSKYNICRRFG